MIPAHIEHTFRALETSASSRDPQQLRNRQSFAPVEGSSPAADARTAGISVLSTEHRAAIRAHERFVEKLYELLPDRADDAYDLVRAEYLAIHGPVR